MTDTDHPITFWTLLDNCQRIVVPQIQRDYAQGRESEKEVRDAFLKNLHERLSVPAGNNVRPLNLDFVYGSMEGDKDKSFLPLDGQQRLTTLFLLHWYLAWRDEQLPVFKEKLWGRKHSRFSYEVRTSSTEFIDQLVKFSPDRPPQNVPSVKRFIEDQPWFFLYWRLDPTIQSTLTMLDAIHALVWPSSELFLRLLDDTQPLITFHLLQLEHFGLSDDLYIKMNARGKPLTTFETFKARFEELLKDIYLTERRRIGDADFSIPKFFEGRMDTQWTHFFWNYKNQATNTFDDAVMNLLWAIVRFSIAPEHESFTDDTMSLRNRQLSVSYTVFHERGWLTREFTDSLICLLEAWSVGGGTLKCQLPNASYFDETEVFQKAISIPAALEYAELARFAAFAAFVKHNEGAIDSSELQEWMRAMFNLIENSAIERPEEYGRSLIGIHKLVPYSRHILAHLSAMEVEQLGFSPQQLLEESIKAKLILAHAEWKSRIEAAEAHGYFRGQIGFLLDFAGVQERAATMPVNSWPEDIHNQLQGRFDDYLRKAQLMFDRDGLIQVPDRMHLWNRALMAIGDYLVQIRSNWSFLTEAATNPDSWKSFLRGKGTEDATKRRYLKSLWDRLDITADVGPQLERLINIAASLEASSLEPWREVVIKHPSVIEYCKQRQIRKDSPTQIYLLRRLQMNGMHAELFSYALYEELCTESSRERLLPLTLRQYKSVTMTEIEPHVQLSFDHPQCLIVFSVEFTKGQFRIYVIATDLPPSVEVVLKDSLGYVESSGVLSRYCLREDIHNSLGQLANSFKRAP